MSENKENINKKKVESAKTLKKVAGKAVILSLAVLMVLSISASTIFYLVK